ncbi:MAG: hypothetical protein WED09_07275 [Homoserinimonas sp.]
MAQTPEQRRAAAATRMREKRARERADREAAKKAAAANAGNADPASTMRDAVTSALAAMKWLVPSDDASVAQAKMLAEDVDLLRHAGETNKALSAQRALTAVLNDLGGTPTVRLQHELRSLRLAAKTGEGDDDDNDKGEGEQQGATVSQFERPAKRKSG